MVSAPPLHAVDPSAFCSGGCWNTQVHPGGSGVQCSGWAGHPGVRALWWQLECASSSGGRRLRQDGASGPPRWGGGKRVSDGDEGGTNLWEPSLVLREAGAKTWGERLLQGPHPCVSFNNGSSLLWQSALPQQAFLVMKLLAPSPQLSTHSQQ